MYSVSKAMGLPVDSIVLPHPTTPSPAVSSISSYGSGTFLIHGHQPKAGHKRKAMSLTLGRRYTPTRITNIIWSGLFLIVIIATVVVVAALAENIRKTLWTRVTFREDGSLQPIGNMLDEAYAKNQLDVDKTCMYRRILWEHGTQSSEIIHDLRSKWSAVIDHDEERCLVFNLQISRTDGCPATYPWDMDLLVGIPDCRGPLARIAPIRKIIHHMCSNLVNLTATGETISTLCLDYKILHVDKVTVQYFDRHLRRVARSVSTPPGNQVSPFMGPLFGDITGVETSKYPRESTTGLNKPTQTTSYAVNSVNENGQTPTEVIKTSTETLTPISIIGEEVVVTPSRVIGETVSIPHSPSPKIDKKSTVDPPSKTTKTGFRNVVGKLDKSKLFTLLIVGAKNFQDKRVPEVKEPEVKEPEEDIYWEGVYNSVDQTANRIVQASTLKDLIEMNKGIIKSGLQPLILEL